MHEDIMQRLHFSIRTIQAHFQVDMSADLSSGKHNSGERRLFLTLGSNKVAIYAVSMTLHIDISLT